jgi:DNA polymerase II large subunit
VADYVREKMGIEPFKATPEEIERMVEEVKLYDRKVNLQYPSTKEELEHALKNLKVELNGDPTEKYEVSANRDLRRIETNIVRSGPVLVLNDGVLLKSKKLGKMISALNISGWEWLSKIKGGKEKEATKKETEEILTPVQRRRKKLEEHVSPNNKYLSGVIAGRPVLSHPSRIGGFRIRYGRSRNTGLAACGMNPNTMYALNEFLAVGTQIKIERPGKAASVLPVSSIEGPVCLLENGDVRQFNKPKALQIATKNTKVKSILFVGDILFGYGEFSENNHPIFPSSYVEEWWALELMKARENSSIPSSKYFSEQDLITWSEHPFESKPNGIQSLALCKEFHIPLHPSFTFHFGNVNGYELLQFRQEIKDFYFKQSWDISNESHLKIPDTESCKRVLYQSFIPHTKKPQYFELDEDLTFVFTEILALNRDYPLSKIHEIEKHIDSYTALDVFPFLTEIKLRDKATYYMGARMGRPEKAKFKKLKHSIQVLFPMGHGKSRNLEKASRLGVFSTVDMVSRLCPSCKEIMYTNLCPTCKTHTEIQKYCQNCNQYVSKFESTCPKCNGQLNDYIKQKINLKTIMENVSPKMERIMSFDINGVEGLTSQFKVAEPIEKGVLRARNDVYVYNDGTIRFDAIDVPLTHFTPHEIKTPVEKLRKMGYTHDYKGIPLVDKHQICELKCQDFVAPTHAGDYFVKVSNFIDDELEYLYDLPRFYNCSDREDLIGHYFAGLSPHTSASIVGRLIGYAPIQALYAHPYWHAAKRRNSDGDEDGIMLMLDLLINFSKYYLSSKIGGKMDAPLMLTVTLIPEEVDSEAWNVDCASRYSLDFYEFGHHYMKPGDIEKGNYLKMDIVKNRLGTKEQYIHIDFTHPTKNIVYGPKKSTYKQLNDMNEKIISQLDLHRKLKAVDDQDVVKKMLQTHFTPDIMGNLRAFAQQEFLCKNNSCGEKFRRVPLSGKCTKCGGPLKLTVTQGSIEKYLPRALALSEEYDLGAYTTQRMKLMDEYVKSLTDNPKIKQVKITSFFK